MTDPTPGLCSISSRGGHGGKALLLPVDEAYLQAFAKMGKGTPGSNSGEARIEAATVRPFTFPLPGGGKIAWRGDFAGRFP